MPKEDFIVREGKVTKVLPNAMCRVALENSGHEVLVYSSGKVRKNKISVVLGDRVSVEISPYDLNRARLVYRYK